MSWMQTYNGNRFYPEDVTASSFDIKDIAHALSNLCRFGGHTRRFYSVAQHSVLVADIVRANGGTLDEELWALMHDATEAYLVDVPTPVKCLLKGYADKEREVMKALQQWFDLPPLRGMKLPLIVKEADGIALITEAMQLITGDVTEWQAYRQFKPFPTRIRALSNSEAREVFLERWRNIQRRRKSK